MSGWNAWHEWQHERQSLVNECWRDWSNKERVALIRCDRALEAHLARAHFANLDHTIDVLLERLPVPGAQNRPVHATLLAWQHAKQAAEADDDQDEGTAQFGRVSSRGCLELLMAADSSGQIRRMILCEPALLVHLIHGLEQFSVWLAESQQRQRAWKGAASAQNLRSSRARSSSSSDSDSENDAETGCGDCFSTDSADGPGCGCLAACMRGPSDIYLALFALVYSTLLFLLDDDQLSGKMMKHAGLSALCSSGLLNDALAELDIAQPRAPRPHRVAALTRNPRQQHSGSGGTAVPRSNPYASRPRPAPRAVLFRFDRLCMHFAPYIWKNMMNREAAQQLSSV
jgi:hypothetical protein